MRGRCQATSSTVAAQALFPHGLELGFSSLKLRLDSMADNPPPYSFTHDQQNPSQRSVPRPTQRSPLPLTSHIPPASETLPLSFHIYKAGGMFSIDLIVSGVSELLLCVPFTLSFDFLGLDRLTRTPVGTTCVTNKSGSAVGFSPFFEEERRGLSSQALNSGACRAPTSAWLSRARAIPRK